MKKRGRGESYDKALIKNLARSLTIYKKITTTVAKGKRLSAFMLQNKSTAIKTSRVGNRLGDNAPQMEVELLSTKNNDEHKADKTKRNTKSVASR